MPKTRAQRLFEEAAGNPPSPPQALPSTRSVKIPKTRTLASKKEKESSQKENTTDISSNVPPSPNRKLDDKLPPNDTSSKRAKRDTVRSKATATIEAHEQNGGTATTALKKKGTTMSRSSRSRTGSGLLNLPANRSSYRKDGSLMLCPREYDLEDMEIDETAMITSYRSIAQRAGDLTEAYKVKKAAKEKAEKAKEKATAEAEAQKKRGEAERLLAEAAKLTAEANILQADEDAQPPRSVAEPVNQLNNEPTAQAESENSQALGMAPPKTPQVSRSWGLSSLVGSIPSSVARFVPHFPAFRRPPIPDFSVPAAAALAPTATPVAPINNNGRVAQTEPRPTISSELVSDTPAPSRRGKSSKKSTRKDKLKAPGTELKPREKAAKDRAEQTKKLFLESQQKLIDEEVSRKVKLELEKQRLEAKKAAEAATVPGTKRKRISPAVIPNPPGCSYGMDLNYFGSDSSDDEEDEATNNALSPSIRPAKRTRMSTEAVRTDGLDGASTTTTPPRQIIGDPSRPTPYVGSMFAKSKGNVFDPSSVEPSIPDYVRNPTGTFTVPYDSDSDSDDESIIDCDDATGSPALPGSASQEPPPRPNPSHAVLPSTGVNAQAEAVNRARSQALRYTPKQPSGLRTTSRLSTSTIASEVGEEDGVSANRGIIAHNGALSELISNENRSLAPLAEMQTGSFVVDDVVAAALAEIPDEQLPLIALPDGRSYAEAGLIDQEVQDALDAMWSKEDEDQAIQRFEREFAEWKEKPQSPFV